MDRKRLLLIIGIIFFCILIISLIFLLLQNATKRNPANTITPTATPIPTFTQEEVIQANETQGEAGLNPTEAKQFIDMRQQNDNAYNLRKARLPFIDKLPYKTNNFKIQIMASQDTVTITTYGNSTNENRIFRQQALDWLTQNRADFNNFRIIYNPSTL